MGMGLYYHYMEIESLTFGQCISLMVLFVAYIAVICTQQLFQKIQKEKENQMEQDV